MDAPKYTKIFWPCVIAGAAVIVLDRLLNYTFSLISSDSGLSVLALSDSSDFSRGGLLLSVLLDVVYIFIIVTIAIRLMC